MTSRENRRQKTSRGKPQLELPKISKPALQQTTYLQRYEWITRNTGYLLLSTPAIEQEQQYIINQLNALNSEYADLLKNLNSSSNTKPLRKSRQININDRSSEIRDREIQNNNALLYKLRAETQLLYRRISAVGNGKNEHDCTIIDIKEKILKTKQKIKELKLRSKEMGDNIENGESGFIDLKRLQDQYEASEIKKNRMEEKFAISTANVKNLQQKLDDINSQAMFADQWINDQLSSQKATEQERSMEQLFKQRSYQLQITKKMIESLRNTKQQKYLQLLRGFQEISQKTNLFDQKLQKLQTKNLYQKKQIFQLQDLLSQTMTLKRSRMKSTEKLQLNVIHQTDQIIQNDTINHDHQKIKLNNITNDVRSNSSANSQKTDVRKYYTNRLRSSNTRLDLSSNKHPQQKQKSNTQMVNKTEVYDVKPQLYDIQLNGMITMIKEPNQTNRSFRTSRSKLRQEIKEKMKVEKSMEIVDESIKEKIKTEEIIEEAMQQSPIIEEKAVNIQDTIKENEQPSIVEEKNDIVSADSSAKNETNKTIDQDLQRKKNLISNYMDNLESDPEGQA